MYPNITQQIGFLGVDMETSAMYTLGQFHGIDICNLLVVSDELWQEWSPASIKKLNNAVNSAQLIVLKSIERLVEI